MKKSKKEEIEDKQFLNYETYQKYKILSFFAISLLLLTVAMLVISVQLDIDIPYNVIDPLAVIFFLASLGIFIFIWIQLARLRLKGKQIFDEREKKVRNKAVYYGMLITIVLSTILIYVIDFLNYELNSKILIMIPITVLCVSGGFFFLYFKRKDDVD